MFDFLRRFGSSNRFLNRAAEEIGVEKKLFKTSLTQMGVNFAILEQGFQQEEQDRSEDERFRSFCMLLIPMARLGAAQLRARFGEQPEIERFVFKMIDYQKSNMDVVDDPEEYRRQANI